MLGVLVTLLSLTACRVNPLHEALKGTLAPDVGNRVITEYCQSCHIHRAFDALTHVPRVQTLYDREPYIEQTQCRACHMVRKDTWGTHRRKTLWPAEVAKQSS
jgi:hypothetical protein